MPLRRWFAQASSLPGFPGTRGLRVTDGEWREVAAAVAAQGGRLLSLWAQGPLGAERAAGAAQSMLAAFIAEQGVLLLELPLPGAARTDAADYPGLQDLFACAARLQRAAADLSGVRSDAADQRPWLRHAAWPARFHPLRDRHSGADAIRDAANGADYEFVRVEGEGVHEIPVGPIHAGIIEPGHFRFSVVGEKVLRLEERLGYVHKGIERRFSELPIREGHRLAARISGDCAVAFSWAYCQALEGLSASPVPARAQWLRALALELERLANHLGDLGALGNDAGLAFALAQFSRLKEQLLRATAQALGQRYLNDYIVPGGVRACPSIGQLQALATTVGALASEAARLRAMLEQHEGVRDRFTGAGTVTPALARRLGLMGLAARASGQPLDLRVDQPWSPYEELAPLRCVRSEGDVAARVAVRFDELLESARLLDAMVARLPRGAHQVAIAPPPPGAFGLGLIEGWRGPVAIALQAGADGGIRRCHPHDCSWQNWPVLEHAILDNIVPDFPLINKSFNLSYSGHDL